MSLKAIHSIYSFSEAPEREASWSTADTTLKIVKNIQFGNNFTSIYLFFPPALCVSRCFCSFPYLKAVLPMSPPGVTMAAGMVLDPPSMARGRPRRQDTPSSLLVGTPHSQTRGRRRTGAAFDKQRCYHYNTRIVLQKVTAAL